MFRNSFRFAKLEKKKSHCTNIDFFCGNVLWKYSLINRKFKIILFQTEISCNLSHLLLMYPYWSKVLIIVSTKIYSTIDNKCDYLINLLSSKKDKTIGLDIYWYKIHTKKKTIIQSLQNLWTAIMKDMQAHTRTEAWSSYTTLFYRQVNIMTPIINPVPNM